jgi:hypothetical protein
VLRGKVFEFANESSDRSQRWARPPRGDSVQSPTKGQPREMVRGTVELTHHFHECLVKEHEVAWAALVNPMESATKQRACVLHWAVAELIGDIPDNASLCGWGTERVNVHRTDRKQPTDVFLPNVAETNERPVFFNADGGLFAPC